MAVEVFERFGGNAGLLGHGRGRPSEDAPTRALDPLLNVNRLKENVGVHLHSLRRDVGKLGDIVASSQSEISVHLLHSVEFDIGLETESLGQLLFGTALEEDAIQSLILAIDHGEGPSFEYLVGENAEEGVGDLGGLDENLVPLLEGAGMSHEEMGKLFKSRIWHKNVFPKRSRRSFRSAG